jgi:hypothetical protein
MSAQAARPEIHRPSPSPVPRRTLAPLAPSVKAIRHIASIRDRV